MRTHMLQVVIACWAACTLGSGLKAESARADQPVAPLILKLNGPEAAEIRSATWNRGLLIRRFRPHPIQDRLRMESRSRRA